MHIRQLVKKNTNYTFFAEIFFCIDRGFSILEKVGGGLIFLKKRCTKKNG